MSLYPITPGSMPQASDVQQIIDLFNGNHDGGILSFSGQITPPTTTGFSLTVKSGTALGVGAYNYKFTLISGYYKTDGTTFYKTTETPASSSSVSATTTSGNQAITVTVPTTGFLPSAKQIGIYRTTAGGSTYGLVGTVKIGNSTFNDTVADANLGAAPPTTNGTGTVLTIPSQPIFTCTPPNTFTSLAASVETTIPYTGGGGYFDSTGIFTCPITGRWLFNPHLYFNVNNGYVQMYVYANGQSIYTLARFQITTTTTVDHCFSPMIILGLNKGDTVKFTVISSSGSSTSYANSPVAVSKLA